MYAMIKELKGKAFRVKSRNVKEAIGVQVTFISENKHQKEQFLYQNKTTFSANYASILDFCEGGNLYTYATTRELKKNALSKNCQNIKRAIWKHVTFMLKIKFNSTFICKSGPFLSR